MEKETLTVETDENGTIIYRNASGQLHNPHGPAMFWADGHKEHWLNGQLHNPHGPAIVWADGYRRYCINGEELTEAEFKVWQAVQSSPLHNKTATIDGVEYTLTAK